MACCEHSHLQNQSQSYRRILWTVLWLNGLMFFIELAMGLKAHSVSLWSDSLDFLGDALNYGISLFVLQQSLAWRAKASLVKAYSMGAFGIWTLATALYYLSQGRIPNYHDMGIIGVIALLINIISAVLLFREREGDSNRASVWLCSRNDALGNIAIMLAAAAVYFTQSAWPDILVALLMTTLALHASRQVIRRARAELRT